ncbi:DNA-binding transcriptional regulator IlvY [Candidatus Arcanobacter lacustris]|uniref:DNA-binding transcriptional regulator IlvY n=1 Tax=Candidatus Arcanibacter lacustris TaxID=1607817 RepID=A0A0F5MNY9_9RICK|nr:DNA-binding transcriptional regulator IlvY [Candidatus Arcanobacter lacustris]
MNYDIFTIKCFCELAKSRSFRITAKNLGRSTSAITQQINKLEEDLGVRVIERTKRNELTMAGQELLPLAHSFLYKYNEINKLFLLKNKNTIIKIGLADCFFLTGVDSVLTSLFSKIVNLEFNIESNTSISLLNNYNNFDLIIIKHDSVINHEDLRFSFPIKIVWACSKNLEIVDNGYLPIMISSDGCLYSKIAIDVLSRYNIEYKIEIKCSSIVLVDKLLKNSNCISIIPENNISQELKYCPNLPTLPPINMNILVKPNIFNRHLKIFQGLIDDIEDLLSSRK